MAAAQAGAPAAHGVAADVTRHGIVVPLPGVTPVGCGGPAFCSVCNAEMIDVEERAISIAEAARKRSKNVVDKDVETLWKEKYFPRDYYRKAALRFIRFDHFKAVKRVRRRRYDDSPETKARRKRNEHIRRQSPEWKAKASAKAKEKYRNRTPEQKEKDRQRWRNDRKIWTPEKKALKAARARRYYDRKKAEAEAAKIDACAAHAIAAE